MISDQQRRNLIWTIILAVGLVGVLIVGLELIVRNP